MWAAHIGPATLRSPIPILGAVDDTPQGGSWPRYISEEHRLV